MPAKFEGGTLPQEHKEKSRHVKILEELAMAFGGYSQVPDNVVGMAIAGQINNNGLKFSSEELDEVVDQICERWEEQNLKPEEVRNHILRGIKEQGKDWPRKGNEHFWNVVDALE